MTIDPNASDPASAADTIKRLRRAVAAFESPNDCDGCVQREHISRDDYVIALQKLAALGALEPFGRSYPAPVNLGGRDAF